MPEILVLRDGNLYLEWNQEYPETPAVLAHIESVMLKLEDVNCMEHKNTHSAENGRLSKGPTSQAGKDKVRQNALRHGRYAKKLTLLPGEIPEIFDQLHAAYVVTFQPADNVQFDLVTAMVSCNWNSGRASCEMNSMMKAALKGKGREDAIRALLAVPADPEFGAWMRYQGHEDRRYQKNLNNLIRIRKEFPVANPMVIDMKWQSSDTDEDEQQIAAEPAPESAPESEVAGPAAATRPATPPPSQSKPNLQNDMEKATERAKENDVEFETPSGWPPEDLPPGWPEAA